MYNLNSMSLSMKGFIFLLGFMLLQSPLVNYPAYLSLYFLLDKLKHVLVLLTLFLFMIFLYTLEEKGGGMLNILLSLALLVLFCFLSKTPLSFFMTFEFSLIPIALLILLFGSKPERLKATFYFLMYTSVGSFPLLFKMMQGSGNGLTLFFSTWFYPEDHYEPVYVLPWLSLIYVFWFLAFLIKTPMYGVHLWLPKAHVEAPTVGSMVLAALLLKLGIYGILRFNVWETTYWQVLMPLLLSWLFLSLLYSSMVSFRSFDIKIFMAYSSMCHMGMVLLGMWSLTEWSLWGVLIISVSHGLSSSGLFSSVKAYYKAAGSRNLLLNPSLLNSVPLFSLLFLMLCCSKASVPPSLSLIGELKMFFCLVSYFNLAWLFLASYIFIVGLYNLFLYLVLTHGKHNSLNTAQGGEDKSLILKLYPHLIGVLFSFMVISLLFY